MHESRIVMVVLLVAACSNKKADPAPASRSAAPAPQAQPTTMDAMPNGSAETLIAVPPNRIDYDLPMVGVHKGGFEVSFALLHLGREDTGQGDLVVFGPDVKPGDKGGAADWTDVCSTRLNAFPYAGVHGFRIYVSGIKDLPVPGPTTRLDASRAGFDLQGDGWAVVAKDLTAHPFEPDVRLVKSDGKEAELELRIREPGKDGSLRGRVRAKICPASL